MGSRAGVLKAAAARIGVPTEVYGALVGSGLKWCGRCRTWHLLEVFGADATRSDGLSAACLESRRAPRHGSTPGKAERTERRARGEAWCRGCRAWLPDADVHGGACRPCLNADARQRYAADPEPIRQRVYARKRGLEPIPTWWAIERLDEFGRLCAYGCGRPADSWDHIWPVSRGGRSVPGNLVPADRSCNSRKSDQDPAAWVTRGTAAFPDEWLHVADLALYHNTDEWLEGAAI